LLTIEVIKYCYIFLTSLLVVFTNAQTKIDSVTANNKVISVSKSYLVHYVDSLLELEKVDESTIELVNYYHSLLKQNQASYTLSLNPNLAELNFYDKNDEQILFPTADTVAAFERITIESNVLSFYSLPKSGVVTSHYGWREGRMHKGTDIDLNRGDQVVAAFDGKVRVAKKSGGFGNVIIIMHPNGLETVYAHLSKFKVKAGQIVLSGQPIGLGGSTGRSSGPHLHFEVRYKGQALNPETILSLTESKTLHPEIIIKNGKHGVCAYPGNSFLHTVQKGESWYVIADKYGLSMNELLAMNGTKKRYYLKVGQTIRVD
jgi:murein DD-endopeptidase MepM/ murein hydrolase activator NlpD